MTDPGSVVFWGVAFVLFVAWAGVIVHLRLRGVNA